MMSSRLSLLVALVVSGCMTGPYDGMVTNPESSLPLKFSGYLEQPGAEVQLLALDARGDWVRVPIPTVRSTTSRAMWGGSTWYSWAVHVPHATLHPYWRTEGRAGRRLHIKARTRRSSTAAWEDVYSFREDILQPSSSCYLYASGRTTSQLRPCLAANSPVIRLQDAAFRGCATTDTTCDRRDDDCNGVVDDQCSEPPGPGFFVARSNTCNEGVGPQDCVTVPIQVATSNVVDGTHQAGELWGFVELPISNHLSHSTGRIYVSADETGFLRVYGDGVPVPTNSSSIAVHLDYERWARDPAILRDTDRRFVVDLEHEQHRAERPLTRLGVTTWEPVPLPSGAQIALGTVTPGTDGSRVDFEMAIPLPASAFERPSFDTLPGIGLAVGDSTGWTRLSDSAGNDRTPFRTNYLERTQYLSVVFGRPEGAPFTFLSWNVAKWGPGLESDLAGGSTFAHASYGELAEVVWSHDVVALQEVWDREYAYALRDFANSRRVAAGLPPFHLVGPAEPPPSFFQANGGGLRGDYQAGLFILTHFPVIGEDHIVYDDCRGEDCLKPKGAQWVRLALHQPVDQPIECFQPPAGANCPTPPTSQMYVDVFNTHLQAKNPVLCESNARLLTFFQAATVQCGSAPAPVLCISALTSLQAAGAHCQRRTSAEVVDLQLQELGAFADRVTEDSRNQPAIFAGDFNIDGRRLRNPDGSVLDVGYERILRHLGVRRESATDPLDDVITPRPDAFAWDVDNGDVARAETQYRWEDCGHGTAIGKAIVNDDGETVRNPVWIADGTGTDARGCPLWSCDGAGQESVGGDPAIHHDKRLDYILVRPPTNPDESPGYLLARTAAPLWQPLWPASTQDPSRHLCADPSGNYGEPQLDELGTPTFLRLSDHRPIVAHFELVPMRIPEPYRGDWNRRVEAAVESVDARGVHDCRRDLCSPLELYAEIDARWMAEGWTTDVPSPGLATTEICEGWTVSAQDGPCLESWRVTAQSPSLRGTNHVIVRLVEDDPVSDDHLATVSPGRNPRFITDLVRGTWDLMVDGRGIAPVGWSGRQFFYTQDPVCQRTRDDRPNVVVCLEPLR